MSRLRVVVGTLSIALGAAASMSGCEREQRRFDAPPVSRDGLASVQLGPTRAGPPASGASDPASAAASSTVADAGPSASARAVLGARNHDRNAYDVAQGKRLYRWFNCNGCHAAGGGSIGPALMDDQWRYGHEPPQIVATILQGRPNGMPSFAGRISTEQAAQLAAYVRSMSGQLREDVAPSRSDGLSTGAPELRRDRETPKLAGTP